MSCTGYVYDSWHDIKGMHHFEFTCKYLYLRCLLDIQINGIFFLGCKFVNLLHGIHAYLDLYSPLA